MKNPTSDRIFPATRLRANLPKIVTYRDWLLAEASSNLRRLKKLDSSLQPGEDKRG
jgi:hypothetical protein